MGLLCRTLRVRSQDLARPTPRCFSLQSSRTALATGQLQDYEDFFRYDSGRWLWNEHARLQERYRRFNVTALQEIAASSIGAKRCVSMNKLAEGGYNKIFRLVMDNDAVVIARIPNPNAGPLLQSVSSEVATMTFASRILGIPVPKILSWNAEADNPVQSEYILMEEAYGTQLGELWKSMDVDSKAEVVDELVLIASKLLSVSFSCYGNIYFSANAFPGCQPAIVEGSLPQDLKVEVQNNYVIGPIAERSFWNGEREQLPAVHGPWNKPQEYLEAIATREIWWLSKYAHLQERKEVPFQAPTAKSPEQHIALYQKFLAASHYLLPKDHELVRSTLWHWDLHAPNIFVTGNKITSVIDWQDCWAGPLLLQAQWPKLVDFPGELTLELPPEYKLLEEGPEKQELRTKVERSILLFTYESEVQRANPVLKPILLLSHVKKIRDVILFASNTWDGGIIPFRECLLRIFRNWKEICPTQECPFTFTQEEIHTHEVEGENWNKNADFWSSISELVDRDGFVLNEDYDEAFEMFAELRDAGLEMFEGDERAEFDRATTWAIRK